MNNLRNQQSYIVGQEVLADVSLPEFLDQFDDLMSQFESKDIIKNLKKLRSKLETLDRCFKFTKTQKLYEKNLIMMQKQINKDKLVKGNNTSVLSSRTFNDDSKFFIGDC